MKALALFAAVATVALSGTAHAAVNLLTNGGFETGNFSGWQYSPNPVTEDYPAVVIPYNSTASYPTGAFGESIPSAPASTVGNGGAYGAYFVSDTASVGSGGEENLWQTVHLIAGQTYSAGFQGYTPANGLANVNGAHFAASVVGPGTDEVLASYSVGAPAKVWKNYYGVFSVLTTGDYNFKFTFTSAGNPAKDVVIDNAFVVAGAVPEPASWALMIGGFGMMGMAMRRRRQTAIVA